MIASVMSSLCGDKSVLLPSRDGPGNEDTSSPCCVDSVIVTSVCNSSVLFQLPSNKPEVITA